MNKLILSLTAFVIALSAFMFTIKHDEPTALGAGVANKDVQQIASTTQTYFGAATAADSRATSTLLTLVEVNHYDNVSIGVEFFSTSTPTGFPTSATSTYVLAQTSYDAITWFNWIPGQVGTNGTVVSTIALANGSGTPIVFSPGGLGTTSRQFDFGNINAKYMRFLVNTQATATIRLYGYLQLKSR